MDDHPVLRAGLRLLIEREADLEVVGQAHDYPSALARFAELKPDLVVLDVDLGGRDGIALAEEMAGMSPLARILVFSGLKALDHVDRALKAGVKGYVVKARGEAELIQAIRAVSAGQSYLCAEAATAVVASYRTRLDAGAPARPGLTRRELEVLKLTAQGLRVKEIARQLNIGIKTVDTYRSSLLAKLGCSSATELARYAIRQGLIDP